MRNTKVVSISLPAEMLEAAETLAKQENRTMSELMREALRVYQRERLAGYFRLRRGQRKETRHQERARCRAHGPRIAAAKRQHTRA